MNLGLLPLEERIVLDAAVAADMGAGVALERGQSERADSKTPPHAEHDVEDRALLAMEEIHRSLGLVSPVRSAKEPEAVDGGEGDLFTDPRFRDYVNTIMGRKP